VRADISLPPEPEDDVSRAARAISEGVSPPFLFNHAVRSYVWGSLFGARDGVTFDARLLYVASLLHDIGLTEAYAGPRCFEHESAAAAVAFARDRGWDADRCQALGDAVRLHMQPRVIPEDGAEAYLLTEATSCDVGGHRLGVLPSDVVVAALFRFPRLDFAAGFVRLFEAEARAKPGCLAGLYLERGLAERIATAGFPT
jgi:hypothetical protein